MNKKFRAMLALALGAVTLTGSFAGCFGGGDDSSSVTPATFKQGTYRTTTAVMPSNWNEFTYADNNDTQILSYISSSFFEYDYLFDGDKFKADGSINVDKIVSGGFVTKYSAATAIEDVTKTVDAKWGYTTEQKNEGGYAWKITLRNDLKWNDGTAIDADDFVYSMKEILNPAFMNMRANTYYDTIRVKRSRAYYFKNQEATYVSVASKGYASNAEAIAAGETLYIDAWGCYGAAGYPADNGDGTCPQWLAYNDTTGYTGEYQGEPDPVNGAMLWAAYCAEGSKYAAAFDVGGQYSDWVAIRVENNDRDVVWEDVGMFKNDDLSFTICLDKSYQFLKEDGSLSYLAAYYMSSLPLVKESLYEECKQEPATGSTLWTSNYNSSLETTASWGPYMLKEFQSGKGYVLEKNDNWYGYNMEDNKNQYNVTKIECEQVKESATNWLMFLKGEVDDAGLDTDHVADYMYSKYTKWAPGSGTYGMQLFSDVKVLKESEYNNGILAIDEFRQAFSLALSRTDVVETIWPGSAQPCYGAMSDMYYYDVEAGATYRNSTEAKEGLLRAYGFTQGADGKWSDGENIENADLEEAYDALTGYNLTLARSLMKTAYEKLTANADDYGYDATKGITIVYGASTDTQKQKDRMAYLQDVLDAATEGTPLAGKITLVFDASAGDDWANAFRTGATQIGFGYGFTGNALNPFDMIGAFVDPDDGLNYHTYWNTNNEKITITLPEGDYEHAGETITMGAANWFYCLNGLATEKGAQYKYNFDAGVAPAAARLKILAALEELVITKSYSIMLIQDFSGSLMSPKFSYLSDEYNMFMGFGGIRYMMVNYTDAEWTAYVQAQGGNLENEYKKTN